MFDGAASVKFGDLIAVRSGLNRDSVQLAVMVKWVVNAVNKNGVCLWDLGTNKIVYFWCDLDVVEINVISRFQECTR